MPAESEGQDMYMSSPDLLGYGDGVEGDADANL